MYKGEGGFSNFVHTGRFFISEIDLLEPIELCDLQPQKHCSQIKVSVPRLVPERKCRKVEKEICNTQLVNPHEVKKPVLIKYCTKKERVKSTNSYLPPPPPKQTQAINISL